MFVFPQQFYRPSTFPHYVKYCWEWQKISCALLYHRNYFSCHWKISYFPQIHYWMVLYKIFEWTRHTIFASGSNSQKIVSEVVQYEKFQIISLILSIFDESNSIMMSMYQQFHQMDLVQVFKIVNWKLFL